MLNSRIGGDHVYLDRTRIRAKRFSQSHWPLERFLYWPTLFRRDEPSHVNEALLA